MIELITGGTRSGKSGFAQMRASKQTNATVGYLATAQAFDDEMRLRIKRHKESRPQSWQTFEDHGDLSEFIRQNSYIDVWILDCVTLWLTGLMYDMGGEWLEAKPDLEYRVENMMAEWIYSLLSMVQKDGKHLIIVTNEVGMGLVPESVFGRAFRDIAGRINQKLAACADTVFLMVSGIPVCIKGNK